MAGRATACAPSTPPRSNANPREIADLRATATVLAPVARASGGSVRFIGAGGTPELRRTEPGREASGSGWIGLPRRHDHVVTGLDAIPLLPPWAALPLLLGLVVVAWRREGSGEQRARPSGPVPAEQEGVPSRPSEPPHRRAARASLLALVGFVGLCLLVLAANGAVTAGSVHGLVPTLARPPLARRRTGCSGRSGRALSAASAWRPGWSGGGSMSARDRKRRGAAALGLAAAG